MLSYLSACVQRCFSFSQMLKKYILTTPASSATGLSVTGHRRWSPSPVMVTCSYEWTFLEWDIKHRNTYQTNNLLHRICWEIMACIILQRSSKIQPHIFFLQAIVQWLQYLILLKTRIVFLVDHHTIRFWSKFTTFDKCNHLSGLI